MFKKTLSMLILAISSTTFTPSYAGTSTGLVVNPGVINANSVFIFGTGTINGAPSCVGANTNKWAIDISTAGGRATMAIVLNAYSLGKTVFVQGTNTCSVWADRESVAFSQLN